MKTRKNPLPVAPFSLRERGPVSQAALTKEVGFFRFAHGKGSDRRATLDPTPCPHCKGKVEWTLTYKREGAEVIPYIYARCRTSPKSHRWDFTHWVPARATPRNAGEAKNLLRASVRMAANRKELAPRPSEGTALMTSWLDKRIEALGAELERLTKIRTLAAEVSALPTFPPPPRSSDNGLHN